MRRLFLVCFLLVLLLPKGSEARKEPSALRGDLKDSKVSLRQEEDEGRSESYDEDGEGGKDEDVEAAVGKEPDWVNEDEEQPLRDSELTRIEEEAAKKAIAEEGDAKSPKSATQKLGKIAPKVAKSAVATPVVKTVAPKIAIDAKKGVALGKPEEKKSASATASETKNAKHAVKIVANEEESAGAGEYTTEPKAVLLGKRASKVVAASTTETEGVLEHTQKEKTIIVGKSQPEETAGKALAAGKKVISVEGASSESESKSTEQDAKKVATKNGEAEEGSSTLETLAETSQGHQIGPKGVTSSEDSGLSSGKHVAAETPESDQTGSFVSVQSESNGSSKSAGLAADASAESGRSATATDGGASLEVSAAAKSSGKHEERESSEIATEVKASGRASIDGDSGSVGKSNASGEMKSVVEIPSAEDSTSEKESEPSKVLTKEAGSADQKVEDGTSGAITADSEPLATFLVAAKGDASKAKSAQAVIEEGKDSGERASALSEENGSVSSASRDEGVAMSEDRSTETTDVPKVQVPKALEHKATEAPKTKIIEAESEAKRASEVTEDGAPVTNDSEADESDSPEVDTPKAKVTDAAESEDSEASETENSEETKETKAPAHTATEAPKAKVTEAPKAKVTEAPTHKATEAPKVPQHKATDVPKASEHTLVPSTFAPQHKETEKPTAKAIESPAPKVPSHTLLPEHKATEAPTPAEHVVPVHKATSAPTLHPSAPTLHPSAAPKATEAPEAKPTHFPDSRPTEHKPTDAPSAPPHKVAPTTERPARPIDAADGRAEDLDSKDLEAKEEALGLVDKPSSQKPGLDGRSGNFDDDVNAEPDVNINKDEERRAIDEKKYADAPAVTDKKDKKSSGFAEGMPFVISADVLMFGGGGLIVFIAVIAFFIARRRNAGKKPSADDYHAIEMMATHDPELGLLDRDRPEERDPPKKKGGMTLSKTRSKSPPAATSRSSFVDDGFAVAERSDLLAEASLAAGDGWGDSEWADFDVDGEGPTFPSMIAYEKNGIKIIFDFDKETANSDTTTIMTTIKSSLSEPLTNFVCKAAVPKYLKLTLGPPSSNVLSPGGVGAITQTMVIKNLEPGKKSLRVRLRVEYMHKGVLMSDGEDVVEFPDGL